MSGVKSKLSDEVQLIAAMSEKEAIDSFIRLISLNNWDKVSLGEEYEEHWAGITCKVQCLLMKVPTRFTLDCVAIHSIGNGYYHFFYINSPGTKVQCVHLLICNLKHFLDILILCGCGSVKNLNVHCHVDEPTENMLKLLQTKRETPMLREIAFSSIRSGLPLPVDEKVLRKTPFPKLFFPLIKRDELLIDVMMILKLKFAKLRKV